MWGSLEKANLQLIREPKLASEPAVKGSQNTVAKVPKLGYKQGPKTEPKNGPPKRVPKRVPKIGLKAGSQNEVLKLGPVIGSQKLQVAEVRDAATTCCAALTSQ